MYSSPLAVKVSIPPRSSKASSATPRPASSNKVAMFRCAISGTSIACSGNLAAWNSFMQAAMRSLRAVTA